MGAQSTVYVYHIDGQVCHRVAVLARRRGLRAQCRNPLAWHGEVEEAGALIVAPECPAIVAAYTGCGGKEWHDQELGDVTAIPFQSSLLKIKPANSVAILCPGPSLPTTWPKAKNLGWDAICCVNGAAEHEAAYDYHVALDGFDKFIRSGSHRARVACVTGGSLGQSTAYAPCLLLPEFLAGRVATKTTIAAIQFAGHVLKAKRVVLFGDDKIAGAGSDRHGGENRGTERFRDEAKEQEAIVAQLAEIGCHVEHWSEVPAKDKAPEPVAASGDTLTSVGLGKRTINDLADIGVVDLVSLVSKASTKTGRGELIACWGINERNLASILARAGGHAPAQP